MEQLVGDFRDGTSSKPGRPSVSDKEERLNGKLHIFRHCEDVNSTDCSVNSNRKIKGGRRQTIIFAIHVIENQNCMLETALKDTTRWRIIKYNFYIKPLH